MQLLNTSHYFNENVLCFVEREGTALLDILANMPRSRRHKVRGDLVINGVTTSVEGLSDRLAYVQQNVRWCPDMTVRQTRYDFRGGQTVD